ncbi:hypothetical protein ASD64_12170 [Mesorhizobium sp. Root157]|uniref:ABC transporter C-terminal domain-containing protein n=1 Tax=Mesorhizobium sp. Root157 TaxID=1736477 RepID=UPI0006FE7297|nr:ABC transporter C-terminal domain-containing protein [Mesorhizobium sp. Root157]KQZ79110.1 hypothetical protein ASD64_12170 [Mesorhizobium sp. Root157]
MADNIFGKASALILTGAGVLGISYGIAKYVTDFEAAKGEIQNLRGQIAQLHEVLAKTQFGSDPARIDRLEARIGELEKKLEARESTAAPVAPAPAAATIKAHLDAGGFDGTASDGTARWPFRVTDVRLGADFQFEAAIEWTTMKSQHLIRGRYSDTSLFFKEVEAIKAGNNTVIGCEYTLASQRPDGLSGTYEKCDGNAAGGTIDVKWW